MRVGVWSARHRKTAVFGWLLLVVAVFMAGQKIGSGNVQSYDAGQAGRVLNQVSRAQYDAYDETVLIQAKTLGVTFSSDPAMRQAAIQVAAALSAQPQYAGGISTPLSAGGQSLVSKDGRSALVTFEVPGNVTDVSQAAATDQHAVATVQARYPDLLIAESGDASIQQAINSALNFSKAEGISVPVTLRGHRRHRPKSRQHPGGARPHAPGVRRRRRAGLRGAAGRLPVGRDPGRVDPLEPAVGGGGLRASSAPRSTAASTSASPSTSAVAGQRPATRATALPRPASKPSTCQPSTPAVRSPGSRPAWPSAPWSSA